MSARVLVADPPWSFGDKLPGKGRGAEKHYDVLDLAAIKKFPLPALLDDAVLFLWRVSSQVEEAYATCRAWGFEPKSELVWLKTNGDDTPGEEDATDAIGMGRIVRGAHETCIVAVRGQTKIVNALVKNKGVRTVFRAARLKHSQKPDKFYEIVESLFDGPYVELFARRERAGWECFGNELARSSPTLDARFMTTDAIREAVGETNQDLSDHAHEEVEDVLARAKSTKRTLCAVCFERQWMIPQGITCKHGHTGAPSVKGNEVSRSQILIAVLRPSWRRWEVKTTDMELELAQLPGRDVDPTASNAPKKFRGVPIDANGGATIDGVHYKKAYVDREIAEADLPSSDESAGGEAPFLGTPDRVCSKCGTFQTSEHVKTRGGCASCGATPDLVLSKTDVVITETTPIQEFVDADGSKIEIEGKTVTTVEPKKRGRKPIGQENFTTDIAQLKKWTNGRIDLTLIEYSALPAAKRREVQEWLATMEAGEVAVDATPPKFIVKMLQKSLRTEAASPAHTQAPIVEGAAHDVVDRKALIEHAVRSGVLSALEASAEDAFVQLTTKAPANWFKKARQEIMDRVTCAACDAGKPYAIDDPDHTCAPIAKGKKKRGSWASARKLFVAQWDSIADLDDVVGLHVGEQDADAA